MSSSIVSKPNVLLAVAGDEVESDLVQLACGMAKHSKGKVYVVHVVEVPRTLPLDANMSEESKKSDAILSRIENIAEKIGCHVEAEIVQARDAGQTLVDEALDRNVGLLIMGAVHRAKYGKFYLGSTIPHVLANAPCRVWIVRSPLPEAGDLPAARLDQLAVQGRS